MPLMQCFDILEARPLLQGGRAWHNMPRFLILEVRHRNPLQCTLCTYNRSTFFCFCGSEGDASVPCLCCGMPGTGWLQRGLLTRFRGR